MSKTVLVVAAHADDEALGCGGAIVRHVADGDVVYAVFMADGVSSRSLVDEVDISNRNTAAEQARKILGIRQNIYLSFPDNQLDSIPLIDVVQQLELIIHELKPSIIYTHHHGDLNVDHQISSQAVMTACRPMPGCSVREIYAFEVMSSTEWAAQNKEPFLPNYFVDISNQINTKLDALRAYELEMRDAPHSRSLQNLNHLACYRGNTVGVAAAEAFMVLRAVR